MNLAQLLVRSATVYPERPAVALGDFVLHDYRTLGARAAALAAALTQTLGLQRGDRVALVATNHPAYLEVMYGAWSAGLAVVPVNSKLHPNEVGYVLADSGAAALFLTADVGASLQPALAAGPPLRHVIDLGSRDYERLVTGAIQRPVIIEPDELAWLFYTSGTTGLPKGVMLSHRNLLAMTLCYFADVDRAERDDAFVYAAPMSHGAGLYGIAHLLAGARHVIPESGGFDPDEFFRLAAAHGDASMFASPTMVKRLVDHAQARDLRGDAIKTIVYGGAPMYAADIARALDVLGDRFVQIYGQGESPMTITALSRAQLADRSHPRYRQRIASVGVAQSAVEVRIADDQGRTLPVGEAGEVIVRGETVMRGYWRDPEATSRTLRDGWLFTGDVGALDDDGFLTLLDRSKDLIISGGSNIYPREVEEVLLRHAGVAEACVVGRAHPDWGEEVVAFVVWRDGALADPAALDKLCLDSIARFKRPKAYYAVAELPKNNYGKVLKRKLRERLLPGQQPLG